jgi:hypothetical protein
LALVGDRAVGADQILRALTRAAGVPEKFDLALTAGWCARIAAAIASDPGTGAFDDLLARRPELLGG